MRLRFVSVVALSLTAPLTGALAQGSGGLQQKDPPIRLVPPLLDLAPKTPVEICDERASSPLDKNRPFGVKGVPADKLAADHSSLQAALNACQVAAGQNPDNPRYLFQFARVLSAAKATLMARGVYTKADSLGYPLATHNLAFIYMEGGYMEAGKLAAPDMPRALSLYEKAANAGESISMHMLGSLYYEGTKVPQDLSKAFSWYYKGVQAGHAPSMFSLGWMYEHGQVISLLKLDDRREAHQWYGKAAEKGHTGAMFRLGWFYDNGMGVPRNFSHARYWYERAATEGNHAAAMNNLGAMYHNGEGVKRDNKMAIHWYIKAWDAGSTLAEQNLRQLREELLKSLKGYYRPRRCKGFNC